jgi:hypothetical protein
MKNWPAVSGALISGAAVLAVGCGGGSTTVVSSTPASTTTTTATTTAQAPKPKPTSTPKPQPAPAPAPAPSTPPKVLGLTLPTAKAKLAAAGFKADVSNTDTLLGIVNPANYTVCKQSPPRGKVVPILAQKYGCK